MLVVIIYIEILLQSLVCMCYNLSLELRLHLDKDLKGSKGIILSSKA